MWMARFFKCSDLDSDFMVHSSCRFPFQTLLSNFLSHDVQPYKFRK
uniref:Uncharacterized protein n=1 Tax=Arundo donax TaxID=35708 RepID=A0A0A9AK78_ARUDO